MEFGGELCYHANQAVPRRTGQHRVRIKPRSRSKQAGFSLSVQLFATSFLPALPTRPLLAALAYADDSQNHGENGAKRQDGLRVHGRHPLSGLPGCGEAPGSSYHARRPCAQPSVPLRQVHRVSGAATQFAHRSLPFPCLACRVGAARALVRTGCFPFRAPRYPVSALTVRFSEISGFLTVTPPEVCCWPAGSSPLARWRLLETVAGLPEARRRFESVPERRCGGRVEPCPPHRDHRLRTTACSGPSAQSVTARSSHRPQ